MARDQTTSPLGAASVTTTFVVGRHTLRVSKVNEGRWTVMVDGAAVDASFQTQAEAWEAGVREADRLDRSVS